MEGSTSTPQEFASSSSRLDHEDLSGSNNLYGDSDEEEETEQDDPKDLLGSESGAASGKNLDMKSRPQQDDDDDDSLKIRRSAVRPPSSPSKDDQHSRIEITRHMDLKSLLTSFESTRVEEIHGLFRFGAYAGLSLYALLLLLVFRYSPADSYEVPEGPERFAHVVSLLLLLVTNGSRILPLVLSENSGNLFKSGFMVGTLSVQLVAMSANCLMGFYPTPVMVDPMTGLRSHLVRWVEWTSLAFLMTFFTSNIEAPLRPPGERVTYMYAVCMAASTFSGLLFPLCRTCWTWTINMTVSCVLFLPIYVLLHDRSVRYKSHRTRPFPSTSTADEQESKEILRASYILCCVCSTTWTGLVLYYIVACVGRILYPDGVFGSPMLLSIGLCFFEIASKIWYLSVLIEAYDRVFDENSRVVRRFEQLRNFMAAVWDSSSDVIIFCGHCDGHINAIVSPAFFKFVGLTSTPSKLPFVLDRGDVSLILDIVPDKHEYTVFAVDLSKPVSRLDVAKMRSSLEGYHKKLGQVCSDDLSVSERSVADLANLTVRACWHVSGDDGSHMADLLKCTDDGCQITIHCEVKRTKVDEGSSVLVLRDISDRIHRFETEKKLLQETTERRKDEETTKFTRHEIKNGILAAIALLDHIKENVSRKYAAREIEATTTSVGTDLANDTMLAPATFTRTVREDIQGEFSELESTLRDVLDTILDQAMAREIVHGQYIARKERMKVVEVLSSLRRRASRRFPLQVSGPALPDLAFDRQLIRFIYRNAVSNACKYGKQDGAVETVLSYNPKTMVFVMEVINAPGDGHDDLLKLAPEEVAAVFNPETQLLPTRVVSGRTAQLVRNESSGNGAWIMQKCAEALGGKCSIHFEKTRTVFTFSCPVEAFPATQHQSARNKDGEFYLPANTWGIAVDDSAIQRKLMDRFLKMAGIHDNRRRILGETSEEVFSMGDAVESLMAANPKDKFILIVDENLDIAVGGTVHKTISGSRCVEKLRLQLDAETESRLLALIRSANDALPDVELYKSRAHGYLHKEPIQKGKVLDVIRPWWKERFAATEQNHGDVSSNDEHDDSYGPSADDIRESVDLINALVAVTDESVLEKRWSIVREKLFVFKGDLKTMETTKSLSNVVHRLDRLVELPTLPENFLDHWANIKSHIESSL